MIIYKPFILKGFMSDNSIEIGDIESFIDGLKNSFDKLGEADPSESQGFQAQLAKAISALRVKKVAIAEQLPEFIQKASKEELKNFLLNQLEHTKNLLESDEYSNRRRFELAMKVVQLREKINNL